MFTPDQTGRPASPQPDLQNNICGSCAACQIRLSSSADTRLLPCLHAVCNDCLTKIYKDGATQVCPLCAQSFSLSEVTECAMFEDSPKNNKALKCAGCEEGEVTGWCVQCEEALCLDCTSAHHRVKVTRDHEVTPQKPPEGWTQRRRCPSHKQETLKFFCLVCEELTCKDCQLITHRGHSFVQQEEAVESQRKHLESLLDSIRCQKETLRHSLTLLEARLQDIEDIKAAAKKVLVQVFHTLYKALVQKWGRIFFEIKTIYEEEIKLLLERKTSLNRLEECQDYISAFIDKVLSTEGHCLVRTKKIDTQVKRLLSQETCTPETMTTLHMQVLRNLYDHIITLGFMKITKYMVPFSSQRTGSTQSKSVAMESSNPTSVQIATDVHSAPASSDVDAHVESELVFNGPALHPCGSSQTVQMNQSLPHSSHPSHPTHSNQATTQSSSHHVASSHLNQSTDSQRSYFSSQTSAQVQSHNTISGQSKHAYSTSSNVLNSNPAVPKTCINSSSSVNAQPHPPFIKHSESQINKSSTTSANLKGKKWTYHYYPAMQQYSQLHQNQQKPANNQIFPPPYPMPVNNQIPPPPYPIPANNQMSVLTHKIPAYTQTVVQIQRPSESQAPLLTQPMPVNNPTSVPTHPVTANNQTPVQTHLIPTSSQTHKLIQPMPANNQTSTTIQTIQFGNQTALVNHAIVVNDQSLILRYPIPDNNQTPVLTQQLLAQNQPLVVNLPNTDNNQTLILNHPIEVNNQTSVQTHLIPVNNTPVSNVHSTGSFNNKINYCQSALRSQNSTIQNLASGSSQHVNPMHSYPIRGNDTHKNLPVKALADSACDQDAGVSSTNFTECNQSENNLPTSTMSETDPNKPDPADSIVHQDFLSTATENCFRQAEAPQSSTETDSRPKHWSDGLTTFRQLVEAACSSIDNLKATPSANSTPCGTSEGLPGERMTHDRTVQSGVDRSETKVEADESEVTLKHFKRQLKQLKRSLSVSLVRLPITVPSCGQPLPEFHLTPDTSKDYILVQECQEGQIKQVWRWPEPPVSSRAYSCTTEDIDVDRSPASDVQFCVLCESAGAALLCTKCGCAFHSDCHIPTVLTKPCEDWVCLLCQDVNETVVYDSEDMRTSSLSLQDQRKCEKLLLGLLCDENRCLLYSATKNRSKTPEFDIILGRLLGKRKPPYRTAAELVSDIWTLFDILMINSKEKSVVVNLQKLFQQRLHESFGNSLHASLLEHSDPSGTSDTETQKEKHRKTLKRMREFFIANCGTTSKKSCSEKVKDRKENAFAEEN